MEMCPVILILYTAIGICISRDVRVPAGPLYRVEGSAISIPCNVSDYDGPHTQNFEWFVYRPAAPDISISIASTKDADFSYAVFAPRVKSGDVYIQRLSGDSVELRIKRLRADDAGVYECYTPTTDAKYLGKYSDKISVAVIPDTLRVSARSSAKGRLNAASPLQLHLLEGQELQLSCTALAETTQHTHLSVSFAVSAPGMPVGRETLQSIISIQRDFSIEAGSTVYNERYLNREIRVEKSEDTTYKMTISRARPQDAGTYHCTAAQWIQDPDGSWQKIMEKRSVLAQVTVQTIESQLKVSSSPREVHVQAGDMTELLCNVSMITPPPPDVLLSVEWWVSAEKGSPGQLVASLNTDGVSSLGDHYAGGDIGTRHISLEKVSSSPGSFRLRIYSAQPGDVGFYRCHVKAFVSFPGIRLEEVSSRSSQDLTVLMRPQELALSVFSSLDFVNLYRGDTAVLLCNITVDVTQPIFSAVSWWVKLAGPDQRTERLLASVNRQGVSEPGSRYCGEDLSLDKVGPHCYRLRMYNIQPEDEGLYHCTVTAWIQYPDHSWYNAASATSNVITVYPYAQVKDLLLIPVIGGVASALFVGITILSTVTCCYLRHLRIRRK